MSDTTPQYELLVLDTLQGLTDSPDMFANMIGTIASTLGEDLVELHEHEQSQHAQGVSKKLHALKGYIPMLCQQRLSDQLAAVEALARDSENKNLWTPEQLGALLINLQKLHQEMLNAATLQG